MNHDKNNRLTIPNVDANQTHCKWIPRNTCLQHAMEDEDMPDTGDKVVPMTRHPKAHTSSYPLFYRVDWT